MSRFCLLKNFVDARPAATPVRGRVTHVDGLESRRLLASSPKLSLPDEITVPVGQAIQVPISGSSFDGDGLGYEVVRDDGVTAGFHSSSNRFLELSTSLGSMRFQLFDDLAPETASRIAGLAEGGFYDGLNFHQVYNYSGFSFAQTGSPNGDGTDGPVGTFDDEFDTDATFNTPGLLAMANTGKDANRSQFFVTGSEARHLDFNHTIFGILVRGGRTLDAILDARTDDSGKPRSEITVKSARVVQSPTDGVLQIRAGRKAGEKRVTISATDSDGKTRTEQIKVNVIPDTVGSPPVLADVPQTIYAEPGGTVEIPIRATNFDADRYEINAVITQGSVLSKPLSDADKTLTLTLDPNDRGPVQVTVGVKQRGEVKRGGIVMGPGMTPTDLRLYDTQQITIVVGEPDRLEGSAPETIVTRPGTTNILQPLATFESKDAIGAGNFSASVEWGDGTVTPAAGVRPIDGGGFGIFATHSYIRDTASALPLRVHVTAADSGERLTLASNVIVAADVGVEEETGTVHVAGTAAGDDVRLRVEDDDLIIRVNDGDERRVRLSLVRAIVIEVFDGADRVRIDDDAVPGVQVDAGPGRDTVDGGTGDDTINGGDGDDRLTGARGDDRISGGDGDDYVLAGAGKNVVAGDDGDDRLLGSNGPDDLSGGGGADRIYGRGGSDTIDGGGGSDRLYGEDGNDLLIGGASNDRLYGGAGNDTLYGNAGSDTLDGGDDDDARGNGDSDDEDDVLRSM